ncbi:EPIDERMAL PATTERNING FACTOR-like protein 6 [Juglans microcarpa x Juglans regia]|uniref:EPIDERMAL PATTERNING FACTOR-like protein 6 n=1 Tax=Juglans microcarpa x Juglans regia TaxID=2249226 RepID=UPI001B7F6FD3|nr:EPIDERMAL PATTERNING FACTOR-like protein 6 [Juglans microcarpa x Juglans regia]
MAPASRKDLDGLKIAVTVMLFFFLTFFPSKSAGRAMFARDRERLEQMKLVLGSRPPRCANKCLSCRPCIAALVTSPHHRTEYFNVSSQRDESYYLLSWKCKCKDKFFQP